MQLFFNPWYPRNKWIHYIWWTHAAAFNFNLILMFAIFMIMQTVQVFNNAFCCFQIACNCCIVFKIHVIKCTYHMYMYMIFCKEFHNSHIYIKLPYFVKLQTTLFIIRFTIVILLKFSFNFFCVIIFHLMLLNCDGFFISKVEQEHNIISPTSLRWPRKIVIKRILWSIKLEDIFFYY